MLCHGKRCIWSAALFYNHFIFGSLISLTVSLLTVYTQRNTVCYTLTVTSCTFSRDRRQNFTLRDKKSLVLVLPGRHVRIWGHKHLNTWTHSILAVLQTRRYAFKPIKDAVISPLSPYHKRTSRTDSQPFAPHAHQHIDTHNCQFGR